MTLRTKLVLMTTALATLLFGVSEWLSYRHITALLDQHEAILIETTDHNIALERLRDTRDHALVSVTTVRVLHAAGTLVIAVAILNLVWYRVIYRPIRELLSQINIMGRGSWTCAIPVKRNDEIGELTGAFNHLGEQLTSTFQHISVSSKMSAFALIGGRLVREVTAVRNRIAAASHILGSRNDMRVAAVAADLQAIERQLETLETRFEAEFEQELAATSATADKGRV